MRTKKVYAQAIKRLYRSSEADGLALPGFTCGLDVILLVGHLRLSEHQNVDEIHQVLTQRLAPLAQSISLNPLNCKP